MKMKISEKVSIPEGVECIYEEHSLKCKKGSVEISKKIIIPGVTVLVKNNEINFESNKANKNEKKKIYSYKAHLKNLFKGLDKKFIYKLEACNVHFPMSLKKEGSKIIINNFLGEKIPLIAEILPSVEVEIKGNQITVSSHNKEAAGQTAANLEYATKVRARDRRIFQDGIFITSKGGDEK